MYNEEERNKFQLHLKSHPALRFSSNFSKFYSGGPKPKKESKVFESMYTNQTVIATQREIEAATLIQRKLRGVLKEKRMRQQLQSRRKDIYYFFKDNCESMVNSVKNERQDAAIQNMLLTKQLEKCRQIGRSDLGMAAEELNENVEQQTANTPQ